MKLFKTISFVLMACCTINSYSQQSLDAYIIDSLKNNFVAIATSSNALVSPVDLDFYPNQATRPMELWILNQGTNSTGGTTNIVFNANKPSRTYKYVKDGNAYHFMALASAMAFGDSNWATSQDILDANRQGGKYTGPTLWSGDLSIYGVIGNPATSQFNGSHLDMIHQSPYGKGIAFENENFYWVLDGYDGNLKRYNFSADHGPGKSYHGDGGVQVYSDFNFTMSATLPSHIVIDAAKKYLYGCDPVGKRIFRVDITTGTEFGPLAKVNSEGLTKGYNEWTGLEIKNPLISGLSKPVGIDVYGNRLIVTDNGTDEIIIFDISNNYKEVGRIKLKYVSNPDPMGVKVGPDGKIYFVDKTNKRAYMIENNNAWPLAVTTPTSSMAGFNIYPNPANNQITIQAGSELKNAEIIILNALGERVLTQSTNNAISLTLDVGALSNGIYFVQVLSNKKFYNQKFINQ